MTIRQHLTSTARVVTTAGLCASIALGSAVVATPASADTHHYRTVTANSSWMNLSVRDGSTDIGTDIIQWWADNNADQQWALPSYPNDPANVYRLLSEGSGMCLTTDGVPGDPVRQQVCDPVNGSHQEWMYNYVVVLRWLHAVQPGDRPDAGRPGRQLLGRRRNRHLVPHRPPTGQVNQVFDFSV